MKVHGEAGKKTKITEKYLGDLICSNGSNKLNLAKRLSSGWGGLATYWAWLVKLH